MNSKKLMAIMFVIAFAANCFGQQKIPVKSAHFHSINNMGLMEGQTGSAFQLQTVNGIQYKSWFGGIGLGLDYYRFRTIPLFADIRKEFGKAGNKFFVFADAGISFYWQKDKDVKQFPIDDKFENGFFGETGVGYKFKLNSKVAFLFSGSYSCKKLTETGNTYYYIPFYTTVDPTYPNPAEKINYHLNRLLLNVGIEF
jgi:hypothetical protein